MRKIIIYKKGEADMRAIIPWVLLFLLIAVVFAAYTKFDVIENFFKGLPSFGGGEDDGERIEEEEVYKKLEKTPGEIQEEEYMQSFKDADKCEGCGDGFFNPCDKIECISLGGGKGCYYPSTWTCKSCSELWADIYYYKTGGVMFKGFMVGSEGECEVVDKTCREISCSWDASEKGCLCRLSEGVEE